MDDYDEWTDLDDGDYLDLMDLDDEMDVYEEDECPM